MLERVQEVTFNVFKHQFYRIFWVIVTKSKTYDVAYHQEALSYENGLLSKSMGSVFALLVNY